MPYHRRAPDRLASLMQWRRNVFVRLDDGQHALICATQRMLTIHTGKWHKRQFVPLHTRRIVGATDALFDGWGWDLEALLKIVNELRLSHEESHIGVYQMDTLTSVLEQDCNFEDYKAFGSFAPLYTEPKRQLMGIPKGRLIKEILEACAEHANPLGVFYAGYKRLMDIAGYSEGSVKMALNTLYEIGWIKSHQVYDDMLMRNKTYYQISPYVLWVSSDYIQAALKLWNQASLCCNVMFKEQPDSESRFQNQNREPDYQPDLEPNNQPASTLNNPITPHPDADSESSDQRQNPDGKDSDPDNQRGKRYQSESTESGSLRTSQQRESAKPEQSPPVPRTPLLRKVTLEECKTPLPNPQHEQLANEVAATGTFHHQARWMIMTYGYGAVYEALNRVREEMKKSLLEPHRKKIRKPVALMSKWLSEGARN